MGLGLPCKSITFFLVICILVVPTVTTSLLAQVNNGWTSHTDKCKVSFEYPDNWVLKIKHSPFDTNMTSEIELYNPELDLTGLYPAFSVGGCTDLEIMKQLQRTMKMNPLYGQFLGNDSIKDAKSLSMFTDSMLSLISSAFTMASTDLQINIVEHTRMLPKFIDNEDAAILSAIVSNSNTQNNSTFSKKVAGQSYSVVHNGTAYVFSYYNDLAKFELPESTQTRERILKSIHFLT
jgi:hypothetical protein